jgi:hypothetical protein
MNPKITVALPLWDSADIAWLCLESLCAQNVGVDWELIVAEEQQENFLGRDGVIEYGPRLRRAGCVNITYIPVRHKMYLASKWAMIAKYADNYYQDMMLYDTWRAIGVCGHDWSQSYQCHFYDIDTKKLVEYKLKKLTGIEMAMSMELARKIPISAKRKGIDLLIYRTVDPQRVYWNMGEQCLKTVCTHGRNKISGSLRKNLINKTRAPFRRCYHNLEDLLPLDIYRRLISESN